MKLRRNDSVVVRTGKDKGKRGKIFRIHPSEGLAYVEGINMVKRHMRPKPGVRQAGIINREAPINLSNLVLLCPSCNKPTRPELQRGLKEKNKPTPRTCKLCQAEIE